MGLRRGCLAESHTRTAVGQRRTGTGSHAGWQMETHMRYTRKYSVRPRDAGENWFVAEWMRGWAFGQVLECWCCSEQQMCVDVISAGILATGFPALPPSAGQGPASARLH